MLQGKNCDVYVNFETTRSAKTSNFRKTNGERMFSKRVKRAAGVLAASALLVAGGTAAQAISNDDIRPDESSYFGWHQGDPSGGSWDVLWNGLYFGDSAQTQIINGLVDSGQRGEEQISADELIAKVENSGVGNPNGSVFYQIAMYVVPEGADDADAEWTTIRNRDALTDGEGIVDLDPTADWTGTGLAGGVTPGALGEVLDAAFGEGAVYEVVGYGVLATAASSVTDVVWDGETTPFGYGDPIAYGVSGDPVESSVADFVVTEGTSAVDVCEGIAFSQGALRYDVEPIAITGETAEDQWRVLTGIAGSLDGLYQYTEGDAIDTYGALHLKYGLDRDSADDITLTPIPNAPEGAVEIEGGDIYPFADGEIVALGDVVQAIVNNADYSVWVEGFSLINDGDEVVLKDLQFYDNVNLVFPGVCDDDETETPEDNNEDPADNDQNDDDDDDAAKPVVADPKYAG